MSDTPLYDETVRACAGQQAREFVRAGLARHISKAPSARYGVDCPTCKVGADYPSRTLKTGRVTDTHKARIDAANGGAA